MFRLFVVLFPLLIYADWDRLYDEESDPTLFHHVNVITGNLNLSFQDTVVEGTEPLPLIRTYTSAGALERNAQDTDLKLKELRGGWLIQGGWNFFPHSNLFISREHGRENYKAYAAEKSGSLIEYVVSDVEGADLVYLKPKLSSGQASGVLSARSNVQNNLLRINKQSGECILFTPDGGRRIYGGVNLKHYDNHAKLRYAKLQTEILPSGQCIRYSYDQKDRLVHVATTNLAGSKTYASIRFEITRSKPPFEFHATTSDGKRISYNATDYKNRDYFSRIRSSCGPEVWIDYGESRQSKGARITRLSIGEHLQFEASYCRPPDRKTEELWAEKPKYVPYQADRIRDLKARVDKRGSLQTVASFSFTPGGTDVRDVDGTLTRYSHDLNNLQRVDYFDEKERLVSLQQFLWSGGRLISKSIHTPQAPILSKTFAYDGAGNVIEETLWGNLSGEAQGPFALQSDGSLAHAEHFRKRYQYLPRFNVPTLEAEEGGPTYRYTYIPETDLLASKLTYEGDKIVKREFFLYDADNLRIAQIVDDGSSPHIHDLTHISFRRIERFVRNPINGNIETIVEAYLDPSSGQEVVLKTTQQTYNSQNLVSSQSIYDAHGEHKYTLRTDYNAQGKAVRRTNALGQVSSYKYNSQGNLLESKEPGSPQKTHTYDRSGKPSSTTEHDHFAETTYDYKGRLLSQADHFYNKTLQAYDPFGRCIKTQFPDAFDENGTRYTPIVEMSYDAQGNIASVAAPRGETTRTFYTALRKPCRIIQPDGTEIRHTYSLQGPLIKTVYPDQTEIRYAYDIFQRMVSKKVYDPEGSLLSSEIWEYSTFHLLAHTDPNGLKTTYTYDLFGRKISEMSSGRKTIYAYDALGFLEKTTQGEVSRVEIHDILGRVASQWDEDSFGRIENHTSFTYDDENRKIKAVRITSQGEAYDTFAYDAHGRLANHTDPLGNTTQFIYDEYEINNLGQRVLQKTTTDPLNNSTIETFDVASRRVSVEKRNPANNPVSREEYFYDRSGNLAKRITTVFNEEKESHTIVASWTYDAMGRPLQQIESDVKTTRYAYDGLGRLIEKQLPSGIVLTYTYDGLGRLIEQKSSDNTIHYRYAYLRGQKPTQIDDLVHNTTLTREYDLFDNLLREITPSGLKLSWEYNSLGRCIQMTLPDGSTILNRFQGLHLVEVERPTYSHVYTKFDPNGHVAEEQLINNLGTISTSHDLLERPSHQTSPYLDQSIEYGPSGLVSKISSNLFGSRAYAYDALSQLIQEGDKPHRFDSLGNPSDAEINRLNQIVSSPNGQISYDPDGNPIEKETPFGTLQYTYDALGRLISIISSEKKVDYLYDPLSRLTQKITYELRVDIWAPTNNLLFFYDVDKEIGACNSSGEIVQLKVLGLGIRGEIGAAVAIELQGTPFAPLHDFGGTIVALVSPEGTLAETYDIEAFGHETATPSSPANPWRFCSKRCDEGLVFFGLRFYDPSLGRWLTPDPSGFTDGPNLYVYVLNSPLNRLDLFGLNAELLQSLNANMEASLHNIPRTPNVNQMVLCKGFIDGVQVDWIVACSHWHQLQFTPEEMSSGTVNIGNHFHELTPKNGMLFGLVSHQNGVDNTPGEFNKNCSSIIDKFAEGTLFVGIYNPTQGKIRDYFRAAKEIVGKETSAVIRTRQIFEAIVQTVHKINPQMLWLHIPHSEAGAITQRAIEGMTPESQALLEQHLYVYALGPALPVSTKHTFDAYNIYSKKDYVTKGFAGKSNGDYNVYFVECISTKEQMIGGNIDHPLLGDTYQGAMDNDFGKMRDKFRFYDGKTR